MAQDLSVLLQEAIGDAGARLRAIDDSGATERGAAGKWSRKEELGHLIDSATNNHVRFVRASLEPELRTPTYDGPGWVRMHGYEGMSWRELVEFWEGYQKLLVRVVARIPEEALGRSCVLSDRKPVTLRELVEDYVGHMRHHLDHILKKG